MRTVPFALLLCGLAVSTTALALQQPDGTVIPTTPSLQQLFDGRGEAISALNDAATTPETFVPSCSLTFEVIQRDSAYVNSFGWYNVTGTKPTSAELFEFLACTDPVGTVKVLDIKTDPNWAGGEVGFYEATGPGCPTPAANANLFFSEKAYNPDSGANPFIHLLTYNSTTTPQAFYFAWEDLLSGGDNDFNDLTTFVTGITCSGGGQPCDTGLLGVCANGLMQCQSGVLTCVQTIAPTTEACDGFDNDCNDLVDEGELCRVGEVCDKGTCVPECSSGEFPCPADEVCNDAGYCVDPDCLSVTCPVGEKCVDGDCLGPCENVVCPFGQVCQLGVCLDPCAPITCDAGQICEAGVCVDKCPCRDCEVDEVCLATGACVATLCETVNCPSGEHCDGATGQCVDDCAGAVCPTGQVCQAGACVEDTSSSGGGGAGGSSLVGSGGGGQGGSGTGGDAAQGGAAAGGSGGQGSADEGCSCSVAPRESSLRALGLLAFLAAWLGRRARR